VNSSPERLFSTSSTPSTRPWAISGTAINDSKIEHTFRYAKRERKYEGVRVIWHPNETIAGFGEFMYDLEYPLWDYGTLQEASVMMLETAGYGFTEN
jgi:hypothetical protein